MAVFLRLSILILGVCTSLTHSSTVYIEQFKDLKLQYPISPEDVIVQCSWSFTFRGNAVNIAFVPLSDGFVLTTINSQNEPLIRAHFAFISNEYAIRLKNATKDFSTTYSFQCATTTSSLKNSTVVQVISLPGPASIAYDQSTLVENTQTTFTCTSAGGYPKVGVEWTLGGKPLQARATTTTAAEEAVTTSEVRPLLSRADHGLILECRVFLDIGAQGTGSEQRKAVTLNVLYKPVVSFNVDYNPYVIVRDDTKVSTITCVPDANPKDSLVIEWYLDGEHQPSQDGVTSLDIDHLGSRTVRCEVNNSLGQGVTETIVTVQSTPTVSVEKSDFTYEEGDPGVHIPCTAVGYPRPTVYWTDSTDKIVSPLALGSSNLTLGGLISRDHMGNYSCVVTVELTPSGQEPTNQTLLKEISVDVLYKPGAVRIEDFQNIEYEVGTSLGIRCVIPSENLGNPAGTIRWSKGGESLTTDAVLSFPSVQPEDMGEYECTASNFLDSGPPTIARVRVKGLPKIVRPYKVAVSADVSVNISCRALSSTPVTFEWKRSGSVIPFEQSTVLSFYEHLSYVTIENVQAGDFGSYDCEATNEKGRSSHSLSLVAYGKPDAPLNLRKKSVTWQAVVLRWDAGFNGGTSAVYAVMAASRTTVMAASSTAVMAASSSAVVNVTNIDDITTQVQGLMPNTEYSFRVHATNVHGPGPHSSPLLVTTDPLTFPHISITVRRENKTIALSCPECREEFLAAVEGRKSAGKYKDITAGVSFTGSEEVILALGDNDFEAYRPRLCFWNRSDVCKTFPEAGVMSPRKEDEPNPATLLAVVIVLAGVCFIAMVCVVVVVLWKKRKEVAKQSRFGSTSPSSDNQRQILQTDTIEPDYTSRGDLPAVINGKVHDNAGYHSYSTKSAYEENNGKADYTYAVVNKPAVMTNGDPPPAHVRPSSGRNSERNSVMDETLQVNQMYGRAISHDSSARRRIDSDFDDQDPLPPYSSRQDSISVASSKSPFVMDNESGYSTPQRKSKKVIYEVIV